MKKLSPAARLRALFPLNRPTGRRVGDWLTLKDGTPCKLGTRVVWIEDPVHVGRIEKIINSAYATVRWEKFGYLTEGLKINELIAYREEDGQ